MQETSTQFEQRKKDHIRIALDPQSQARVSSGLESVQLVHEALPELNFSEVKISKTLFSHDLRSPIFISSMTAGHVEGKKLNQILAVAAENNSWAMGVGSQRRELYDPTAESEWRELRKAAPKAVLFGNLGLAQVIEAQLSNIHRLVDNLEASALFVHTNPLQEVLQKEGTPNFKGGMVALEKLCSTLSIPVILKEVGCGFSLQTLQKIKGLGLYAVDVAGLGGTHWGKIEGSRSEKGSMLQSVAGTFQDWGVTTLESLISAKEISPEYRLWASGGVRSGLDVAKLLALGAEMVGIARPFLQAAVEGEKEIETLMKQFEYELKVSLFCTGSEDIESLQKKRVWSWK